MRAPNKKPSLKTGDLVIDSAHTWREYECVGLVLASEIGAHGECARVLWLDRGPWGYTLRTERIGTFHLTYFRDHAEVKAGRAKVGQPYTERNSVRKLTSKERKKAAVEIEEVRRLCSDTLRWLND